MAGGNGGAGGGGPCGAGAAVGAMVGAGAEGDGGGAPTDVCASLLLPQEGSDRVPMIAERLANSRRRDALSEVFL